jgi:hypothetical protein
MSSSERRSGNRSARRAASEPVASSPWWRTGVMWLVVGGPLAVVVAGIVTAVIAIHGADVVIDDDSAMARSGAHAPAVKARNHAATPE